MKKRLSRKLLWVTIPTLLLGAAALWISKSSWFLPKRALPSDLHSGKPRLELGELEAMPISGWDASQGFVWGKKTSIWQKGQLPIAADAHRRAHISGSMHSQVVYLHEGHWKQASSPTGRALVSTTEGEDDSFGNFAVNRPISFLVRLDGVPADADEVHLRGDFRYVNVYSKKACKGIKPGPSWKIYPGACYYTTLSRPFDFPIKAQGEPWPQPTVSRTPNLQMVAAYWIHSSDTNTYTVALHLRDPAGILAVERRSDIACQNFSLRDRSNREIPLYESPVSSPNPKRADSSTLGLFAPGVLGPGLPSNERVAILRGEPLGGWASVKGPLHLHAEISDWTNWPTTIDATINLTYGELRDIGKK